METYRDKNIENILQISNDKIQQEFKDSVDQLGIDIKHILLKNYLGHRSGFDIAASVDSIIHGVKVDLNIDLRIRLLDMDDSAFVIKILAEIDTSDGPDKVKDIIVRQDNDASLLRNDKVTKIFDYMTWMIKIITCCNDDIIRDIESVIAENKQNVKDIHRRHWELIDNSTEYLKIRDISFQKDKAFNMLREGETVRLIKPVYVISPDENADFDGYIHKFYCTAEDRYTMTIVFLEFNMINSETKDEVTLSKKAFNDMLTYQILESTDIDISD